MILAYQHRPLGEPALPTSPRLRTWDDSSPYHSGRPLRGPRGGDVLRLVRKPITFRNVPTLERITVHSFAAGAGKDSTPLHVAGMAIQAITGVRCTPHKMKRSIIGFGMTKGRFVAVKSELFRETMWDFLAKCVDIVMPRIKDWQGIPGTSGDASGNISFGLGPEEVAFFPEIEFNYDA